MVRELTKAAVQGMTPMILATALNKSRYLLRRNIMVAPADRGRSQNRSTSREKVIIYS